MRPNRYVRDFIISYCNNKNTLKIICAHKIENSDFLLRILKFKKYNLNFRIIHDNESSVWYDKINFDEKLFKKEILRTYFKYRLYKIQNTISFII